MDKPCEQCGALMTGVCSQRRFCAACSSQRNHACAVRCNERARRPGHRRVLAAKQRAAAGQRAAMVQRAADTQPGRCEFCGKRIQPPRRKFCSADCGKPANYMRWKLAQIDDLPTRDVSQRKHRECLWCGKWFMSWGPGNRRCPACTRKAEPEIERSVKVWV